MFGHTLCLVKPLSSELVSALDLHAATERLAEEPSGMLPSPALRILFWTRADDWPEWVEAQLRRGVEVERQPSLLLPKRGSGYRPLTPLTPLTSTVFSALVAHLAPSLPVLDRTHSAYEDFARSPLDIAEDGYVAIADVVAFHDVIDHGVLLRELVDLCGTWEGPSATIALLHDVMERDFGLPQLHSASDQLAECVIDVVRRNMVRRGFTTFRYSDDFRLVSRTWGESQRAVESLYEELRALGLVLNEAKSLIMTSEHYADWVREPAELWAQVLDVLEIDEDFFPALYEMDNPDIEAELIRVGEDAGIRALKIWSDPKALADSHVPGLRGRFLVNLATLGLRTLGQVESSAGLAQCRRLLTHEPGVSKQVAWYLLRTLRHDPDGVDRVLRRLLTNAKRPYLMPWQQLWILEVLREMPQIAGYGTWLKRVSENARSPYVSGYAALVRARHGLISPAEVGALFNSSPEVTRLDLALAAGILSDGNDKGPVAAIAQEGPPYSWLVASAALAL